MVANDEHVVPDKLLQFANIASQRPYQKTVTDDEREDAASILLLLARNAQLKMATEELDVNTNKLVYLENTFSHTAAAKNDCDDDVFYDVEDPSETEDGFMECVKHICPICIDKVFKAYQYLKSHLIVFHDIVQRGGILMKMKKWCTFEYLNYLLNAGL